MLRDQFRRKLCIGKAIQREQTVQYDQGRDFKHNLSHNGKYKRISSQSQRLKYTDCQESQY